MICLTLSISACTRDPVQRGDAASIDLSANTGFEMRADAGLQVSLYRNPKVARGITIYRVHAAQTGAARRFFDVLVATVGLIESDGVDTFQRDMVRGIGHANAEFRLDFDQGTLFGAKVCPPTAQGDPSGLIALLSPQQEVYLVLYGGSFVRQRTRGALSPLRSSCVFGTPAA